MGTVGDLIAKLFCDSTDFDKNIKKSQKEVQEFKRKTEREAAKINGAFNSIGSAVAKVNPGLGDIIGSLGKVAPLAAAGAAAFGLFKQVVQQSESAMDDLDKKTAQLSGAWEHITTTMSNGNIFSGMTSSLRDAVGLAKQLAEIMDNLGTLSGYHNLNKSEAEADLAKLKEMIKAGASKEDINKQVEKTKSSIISFDNSSSKIVSGLKEKYDTLIKEFYDDIKRQGHIGLQSGKNLIEKFATNLGWRESIESWKVYFDKNVKNIFGKYTKLDSLKTNKTFEKFLNDANLFDSYLFNDFKRGGSEGKEYIKDIISIITGVLDKKEDSKYGIENIQKTRSAWLDTEREASETHSSFYKRMSEYLNKPVKPAKPGKGGVYTSKQEAPKERTLQDILDDLDKSLVWNKYLAQNLGEDITGSNLSTLEKTANELKDLLKDTTDEEQRKQILSVLKTVYNIINKPKEDNKPTNYNDDEYKDLYGKELGSFVLNAYSKYNDIGVPEFLNKVKENFLNKAPKNFYQNLSKGLITDNEVYSPEIAEKFNYSADSFLNSKQASFSKYIRSSIQSVFDVYKDTVSLDAATLKKAQKTESSSNYKYISSPYFGDLRKFNIPIKYPEKFYYENLASSKFSSGVLSIVKKYIGFDSFREEFAKNAYSEFDRLISEDKIITPNDVNEILYQIYSDTIKKYSGNAPDFFKNSEEFTKFINNKTKIEGSNESISSKLRIKIGTKNLSTLFFDSIINDIDTKEAAAGLNKNLVDINSESKKIKTIGYDQSAVIDIINKLSENNVNIKAGLIDKVKKALIERRKTITNYINKYDTSADIIKLEDISNNLKLIQLEKEKRLNKGILPEDKQKEYEELVKHTDKDYSGFTDKQLEIFEETSKTEEEKLRKAIEENNKIKEDLINKLNQTDEIRERLQKEEDENDVLRERRKELSEISNKYMSVADSAYQIGAAFSSLDSKFGDIASVLLNVVGITAEAIGKLIGMATAQGVSNAFKLPWPQNLAAVATVIAAGASAAGQIAGLSSRKYATGGIVSGPGTSISDSIPIRVSNGEMILNHRQQSNLFNLLDKGRGTEGKIEFKNKLVGSDIIGSATTYNKRRNLIL